MIIDPDFLDHWRTRLVVDSLGDELAPLYIIRIWSHCQNRKSVRFEMSTPGLRALCRFAGQAEKLEIALIDAGFIDREGPDVIVPKWADKNSQLFATWANGARGGRPRKETNPKPTGLNGKTHGQPTANPGETDIDIDKRETRDVYGQPDAKTPDASRLPLNGRGEGKAVEPFDLSAINWQHVVAMAEGVARKIPPTNGKGRRCWLKYAVLAENAFGESWLKDAVEAVLHSKQTRGSRQGHFVGVLKSKAKDQHHTDAVDFKAMMDRIEIPGDIWNDKGILEIRK
jgi:hypothetical protein